MRDHNSLYGLRTCLELIIIVIMKFSFGQLQLISPLDSVKDSSCTTKRESMKCLQVVKCHKNVIQAYNVLTSVLILISFLCETFTFFREKDIKFVLYKTILFTYFEWTCVNDSLSLFFQTKVIINCFMITLFLTYHK